MFQKHIFQQKIEGKMIDNKYYKIQRNKHKELIIFFSRIVDDEIDEDIFFNEVLF